MDIDIAVEHGGWNACGFNAPEAARAAVLESMADPACRAILKGRPAEISIVLADDLFVRALNRDYRGKDKPTNVLSFPQTDFTDDAGIGDIVSMGDIILACETVMREAKEQEKTAAAHFTHLVVHGVLHLLGYDHEEEEEAETMEKLEISVLARMGIENPYTDDNLMA